MPTPSNRTRTPVSGLVIATHASRNSNTPRQMTVRTEARQQLTGTIPSSVRAVVTTLIGRRIQFTAFVDHDAGRFSSPRDGVILAPAHMQ